MDQKALDKDLLEQVSPMRRYRNLLIALAAIASIFLVKWTGIDAGLIDNALHAGVDAITAEETPVPVELPAETAPYNSSNQVIEVEGTVEQPVYDSPTNLSEEQR